MSIKTDQQTEKGVSHALIQGRLEPTTGCIPIFVTPIPQNPSPSETIAITVEVSPAATADTPLSITFDPSGSLTLNGNITVGQGNRFGSGTATVSPNTKATSASITASCNGGQAAAGIAITAASTKEDP
jgi:hypothetical protein